MCGITGAVSFTSKPLPVERLKGMVDIIAHRGPDDAGLSGLAIRGKDKKEDCPSGVPFQIVSFII